MSVNHVRNQAGGEVFSHGQVIFQLRGPCDNRLAFARNGKFLGVCSLGEGIPIIPGAPVEQDRVLPVTLCQDLFGEGVAEDQAADVDGGVDVSIQSFSGLAVIDLASEVSLPGLPAGFAVAGIFDFP